MYKAGGNPFSPAQSPCIFILCSSHLCYESNALIISHLPFLVTITTAFLMLRLFVLPFARSCSRKKPIERESVLKIIRLGNKEASKNIAHPYMDSTFHHTGMVQANLYCFLYGETRFTIFYFYL